MKSIESQLSNTSFKNFGDYWRKHLDAIMWMMPTIQ